MKLEKGELKPFSEKEKLPSISIPSYDPRGREGVIERAEESVADKNPLYGFHRFSKSVTFTEEVDLNGALIYVAGIRPPKRSVGRAGLPSRSARIEKEAFTPWSQRLFRFHPKGMEFALSFVPVGTQHDECVCCLAANLSCTRLPWSASSRCRQLS